MIKFIKTPLLLCGLVALVACGSAEEGSREAAESTDRTSAVASSPERAAFIKSGLADDDTMEASFYGCIYDELLKKDRKDLIDGFSGGGAAGDLSEDDQGVIMGVGMACALQ